jgi:hypothetical protein
MTLSMKKLCLVGGKGVYLHPPEDKKPILDRSKDLPIKEEDK